MEYQTLNRADARFPKKFNERLGADAPSDLWYAGPIEYLDGFTLGVLCSDEITGEEFQSTNQLLFTIRDYSMNMIGPWHSMMETEIFRLGLYRPYIRMTLFSSKGLPQESFDGYLRDRLCPPLDEFPERKEYFLRAKAGRLLVLSVAPPETKRMDRTQILRRNLAVAALSDALLIAYCEKGSKTLATVRRAVKMGMPVFTSEHRENKVLTDVGVRVVDRKSLGPELERWGAHKPTSADIPPPVEDADESAIGHRVARAKPEYRQGNLFPEAPPPS